LKNERDIDINPLWDNLIDLIIKTVISGEPHINKFSKSYLKTRYNTFELLGIDIMFDEFLKPWLLEVYYIIYF